MHQFESANYVAKPLSLSVGNNLVDTAHTAWKLEVLVRKCAAHEMFFTGNTRGCDGGCGKYCTDKSPNCALVKQLVMRELLAPDALVWEVWRKGDVDFVGILRLTRVRPGEDAFGHYFFFDGKLPGKLEILQAWKEWCFTSAAGWEALHRITLEIPAYAHVLAKHAGKLGFTDEGARKEACLWRGGYYDMLIMGCVNGV